MPPSDFFMTLREFFFAAFAVHDPARPHDAQIFFVRRKRGVVQNEGIDDGEVFVFETRVEDDAKRLFLRLHRPKKLLIPSKVGRMPKRTADLGDERLIEAQHDLFEQIVLGLKVVIKSHAGDARFLA